MKAICSVDGCEKPVRARTLCISHYQRMLKFGDTNVKQSWQERFWNKVTASGDDECWIWQGGLSTDGYGAFHIPSPHPHEGSHKAHRVSIFLKTGIFPSSVQFVCHSCDNPPCVNPNHLWIGNASSNAKDMKRKGRCRNKSTGAKHWDDGHECTLESCRTDKYGHRFFNPGYAPKNARHSKVGQLLTTV